MEVASGVCARGSCQADDSSWLHEERVTLWKAARELAALEAGGFGQAGEVAERGAVARLRMEPGGIGLAA